MTPECPLCPQWSNRFSLCFGDFVVSLSAILGLHVRCYLFVTTSRILFYYLSYKYCFYLCVLLSRQLKTFYSTSNEARYDRLWKLEFLCKKWLACSIGLSLYRMGDGYMVPTLKLLLLVEITSPGCRYFNDRFELGDSESPLSHLPCPLSRGC